MFRPAFGCGQHPKAGRNTQQPIYTNHLDDYFFKMCVPSAQMSGRTNLEVK